jgi:hypothetical protein
VKGPRHDAGCGAFGVGVDGHANDGVVGVGGQVDTIAGVTLPVAAETAGQIRNDAARDTQALRSFTPAFSSRQNRRL